jgi:membrane-associated phospholipid phosphatase
MVFNVHRLIDRTPELPYFIIALFYLFSTSTPSSIHVFSQAFLFVVFSLALGLLLKSLFKTERPRKHYDMPALRYDFPSLHSMISIGMIVFMYFVDPLYAMVLLPIGLFYLYSRVKVRAHSVAGVLGGAFIGTMLGLLFGLSLSTHQIPEDLEVVFSVMLFCMPLFSAAFRIRYSKLLD